MLRCNNKNERDCHHNCLNQSQRTSLNYGLQLAELGEHCSRKPRVPYQTLLICNVPAWWGKRMSGSGLLWLLQGAKLSISTSQSNSNIQKSQIIGRGAKTKQKWSYMKILKPTSQQNKKTWPVKLGWSQDVLIKPMRDVPRMRLKDYLGCSKGVMPLVFLQLVHVPGGKKGILVTNHASAKHNASYSYLLIDNHKEMTIEIPIHIQSCFICNISKMNMNKLTVCVCVYIYIYIYKQNDSTIPKAKENTRSKVKKKVANKIWKFQFRLSSNSPTWRENFLHGWVSLSLRELHPTTI